MERMLENLKEMDMQGEFFFEHEIKTFFKGDDDAAKAHLKMCNKTNDWVINDPNDPTGKVQKYREQNTKRHHQAKCKLPAGTGTPQPRR